MGRVPPTGIDALPPALVLNVENVCRQFELAWKAADSAGPRPRIEDCLEGKQDPERSALLHELVQVEIEYRSGRGEKTSREEYQRRFPVLDPKWLADVLGMYRSDLLAPTSPPYEGGARGHGAKTPPPGATPTGPFTAQYSRDAIDAARFSPGTILADRYRIVGLLGKGGMGEVYRADDLTLGQSVALKFLPQEVVQDAERLAGFRNEVRIARQVSHANVCRVYDIGEFRARDGSPPSPPQVFLSMEYIDGEDLASLLRRIGRLPEDKGIDIARQLCLGLAAAHDKGVLHRDLKPKNIMIDGQGQVRITDFGLAAFADELSGADLRVGTWAYMAPEQLAGKAVTIKSDLYALGLVLYEIFTGKRAFKAKDPVELARVLEEQTPSSPSSHVAGLSPLVERTILRCLEKDPQRRPPSAVAVAAGLPGGDPLAAALAAGETPSPQMVADAGPEGSLHPLIGASLLAAILLGIWIVGWLADKAMLYRRVPLDKSPEVLKDHARRIIGNLGYADLPALDSAYVFEMNREYLSYVWQHDQSSAWRDKLATGQPAAVYFWFGQSSQYLSPIVSLFPIWPGQISPDATYQPFRPGRLDVYLDLKGRLLEFRCVPERVITEDSKQEVNWDILLEQAGLDRRARLAPAAPEWNPPVYADKTAAWEGVYPEQPDIPIRIEAAAYHGKVVYFRIIEPWSKPARLHRLPAATVDPEPNEMEAFDYVFLAFMLIAPGAMAPFAWRNWRLGRVDRRGAGRLALVYFMVCLLVCTLMTKHVPSYHSEIRMFTINLGYSAFQAGLVWVGYLALEPYIRRRWPWRIISWNRLLAGRFRDPLIGRHVLIGGLLAVLMGVIFQVVRILPTGLERHSAYFDTMWGSFTNVPAFALQILADSLQMAWGCFAMFFLLFLICRRQWLAGAIFAVMIISAFLPSEMSELGWSRALGGIAAYLVYTAFLVFLIVRCGVLALAVYFIFILLFECTPITTDFSTWYSTSTICYLLILAGLAVYGFIISLGHRPLFRDTLFQQE